MSKDLAGIVVTDQMAATMVAMYQSGADYLGSYKAASEYGGKGAVMAALVAKRLVSRPNSISQSYDWEAREYRLTRIGNVWAARIARGEV